MESAAADARQQARRSFDAGQYDRSLKAAREGLSAAPDDVELLVLAGRAGIEMDAEDAVAHLRRATELASQDAGAWHHLGEALAAEGSTAEADAAFRRAVELDPDDELALTHLGHTSLASGRRDEGLDYLARAAELASGTSTAVISLVDMYRSAGQFREALAQAEKLAEAAPHDVLTWLDMAELSLVCGQLDQARSAFERVRELDDVPGHEVYPLHGLIQVEIAADNWDRAWESTEQAAAIDPYGLSTDVAAFVRERSGQDEAQEPQQPPPTREEVDAALAASLAEYRRMLIDDRHLTAGEFLG